MHLLLRHLTVVGEQMIVNCSWRYWSFLEWL